MVIHCADVTIKSILAHEGKVHEAWDPAHSQIYSPISPFSTKPLPILEQKCIVLWLLWSNPHVCMITHDVDAISTLILVHEQGS